MPEKISARLEEFGKKPTEHVLYWTSIWCILAAGMAWLIAWGLAYGTGHPEFMDCRMKQILGIPCPGCGGTRAILSLLHGKIFRAVYYNAFAVYSAVWYLLFFFTQTAQRISGGKLRGMRFRESFMYVAVFILFVQYLLKLFVVDYVV
ncbi:MAG: DUF2752 domain-containing protein [Lachnospiraceae bacterium]|nr:DUF2752 domain-containing protein [Lachnospiraceae bacterium]